MWVMKGDSDFSPLVSEYENVSDVRSGPQLTISLRDDFQHAFHAADREVHFMFLCLNYDFTHASPGSNLVEPVVARLRGQWA